MTSLQEDLTGALHRRAEAVTIDDNLDAIVNDHNIVRFSHDNGPNPRRRALIAASVAMLVGAAGLIWVGGTRDQSTATVPASPLPVDTIPPTPIGSTPSLTAVTIPTEFPSDVPRPDTFHLMGLIGTDTAPAGWQFYDAEDPQDSVERCLQYASLFDESWTSTAEIGHAPPDNYAQTFDNGQWHVGIYCHTGTGYYISVEPANATSPPTPDTLPTAVDESLPTPSVPDASATERELQRFAADAWLAAVADISEATGWALINSEFRVFTGGFEFSDGSTHVQIVTGPPEWRAVVVDPDVAGETIPEGTMYLIDATGTEAARVLIVVAPDDVVTADFSPANDNVEEVIDAARRIARVSIAIRDHSNAELNPN